MEDVKLVQHGGLVSVYWHLENEDGPDGGDWFDALVKGSNHSNNTLTIEYCAAGIVEDVSIDENDVAFVEARRRTSTVRYTDPLQQVNFADSALSSPPRSIRCS